MLLLGGGTRGHPSTLSHSWGGGAPPCQHWTYLGLARLVLLFLALLFQGLLPFYLQHLPGSAKDVYCFY